MYIRINKYREYIKKRMKLELGRNRGSATEIELIVRDFEINVTYKI